MARIDYVFDALFSLFRRQDRQSKFDHVHRRIEKRVRRTIFQPIYELGMGR